MMNSKETKAALAAAVAAARAAGGLMRKNLNSVKRVKAATQYDIKLELDVRCQHLIEQSLHRAFPQIPLLGEEGDSGAVDQESRWVVDPIDGTVNYAHGIPHAAVSIALQKRGEWRRTGGEGTLRPRVTRHAPHVTLVGVIYDPFLDELWTAVRGQPARCNGRVIHVSQCARLNEALVAVGFAKSLANLRDFLPYFARLSRRVRKVRMGGSAALALTYVAMGRLDAYIERRINLWDFAAGALIVECAGGDFWCEPVPGLSKYRILASNGTLKSQLSRPA